MDKENSQNVMQRKNLNLARAEIPHILSLWNRTYTGEGDDSGKSIEELGIKTDRLIDLLGTVPGAEFFCKQVELIRRRAEANQYFVTDFPNTVYQLGEVLGANLPELANGMLVYLTRNSVMEEVSPNDARIKYPEKPQNYDA